ncbi:TPM domain-containing protein [Streptomyces sp. NPDC093085]|uniref:TPM domain-containing protein n=1 Tax=Streptomyces sp. NPDC093085 TaxID=3155068 RepID=UPI003414DAAE
MTPTTPSARSRARARTALAACTACTALAAPAAPLLLLACWAAAPGAAWAAGAALRSETGPGGAARGGGAGDAWILPLLVVLAAVAVAAYTFVRRSCRARFRTTPGGRPAGPRRGTARTLHLTGPASQPLPELTATAGRRLTATDDALRTSQEELAVATARFGAAATAPFADAVAFARGELTVAFRSHQELDEAETRDDAARRGPLDEIVARCAAADRRLDAEAEAFDRLRAPEREAPEALAAARAAYRALSGRTDAARATLAALRERYAGSASAPVADGPEQAADRLLFASDALDTAAGFVESGDNARAAVHVRAAEGAVGQAAALIESVERRAREVDEAAGLLPAALTEAEAALKNAHALLRDPPADAPTTAALRDRVGRAEAATAEVRRAVNAGPHDPLDALRRIEEAEAALDGLPAGGPRAVADTERAEREGAGRHQTGPHQADPERTEPERTGPERTEPEQAGPTRTEPEQAGPERTQPEQAGPTRTEPGRTRPDDAGPDRTRPDHAGPGHTRPRRARLDRALLTARSAHAAAGTYVTTHRGAAGSQARTRLSEAGRHLEWAQGQAAGGDPRTALAEAVRAGALAREAQALAERDVRAYDSHYGAPGARAMGGGVGGALLGGILVDGAPAAFGGTGTRARLNGETRLRRSP